MSAKHCYIPLELRDKFAEGAIFTMDGYPQEYVATYKKNAIDSHDEWQRENNCERCGKPPRAKHHCDRGDCPDLLSEEPSP